MRLHLVTVEDPLTRQTRAHEWIRFPQLSMPLLAALTPEPWVVTHTDEITHAVDTTQSCDLVGLTAATPGAPHAHAAGSRGARGHRGRRRGRDDLAARLAGCGTRSGPSTGPPHTRPRHRPQCRGPFQARADISLPESGELEGVTARPARFDPAWRVEQV